MEFVALDVETANADSSSICQIGIARFVDGCLTEEWSTLVNPEDYFDSFNVSIHGITEDIVEGFPCFSGTRCRNTVPHARPDCLKPHSI